MLSPQPSDDPNDPLNWPLFKRAVAYCVIAFWTSLGSWIATGPSSAILLIMQEFNSGLQETVNSTLNYTVLMISVGVCAPLADG